MLVRLMTTATLAMRLSSARAFTTSSSLMGRPGLHHFVARNRCSPAMVLDEPRPDAMAPATPATPKPRPNGKAPVQKLEGKLLKGLRECSLDYQLIEDGDHIMVAVSGGKDSATMLHLLILLQRKLAHMLKFKITAVNLDQQQPGWDGSSLEAWLKEEGVDYRMLSEDTYSVVKANTPEGKTYCSLCSRLRRGILYTCAHELGANKLALGHHSDDAAETLLLNMIHQGQTKAMPARYYSEERDMHVIRPLMYCFESDILEYATLKQFPILPCNLCGSTAVVGEEGNRDKMALLVDTLESLNPNVRKNLLNAMQDIRPSHMLDQGLRESAGLDPVTGSVAHERARAMKGYKDDAVIDWGDVL